MTLIQAVAFILIPSNAAKSLRTLQGDNETDVAGAGSDNLGLFTSTVPPAEIIGDSIAYTATSPTEGASRTEPGVEDTQTTDEGFMPGMGDFMQGVSNATAGFVDSLPNATGFMPDIGNVMDEVSNATDGFQDWLGTVSYSAGSFTDETNETEANGKYTEVDTNGYASQEETGEVVTGSEAGSSAAICFVPFSVIAAFTVAVFVLL